MPKRHPAEPRPPARRGAETSEAPPWDGADTTRESIALAADRDSSTLHLDVRDVVRLSRALPGLTLEQEIGRGSFGVVYRARWVLPSGLERRVAVKEVRAGAPDGEELAQRLRDEGRLLGRLNHRAIVRVEEVLTVDGWPAILTELVEGADLDDLLRRGRPPARAAAELLAEVASALEAAHAGVDDGAGGLAPLVHHDIKPANVRVTRWGEVKVLDFGAARLGETESVSRVSVVGSSGYLSPEARAGRAEPASDIYALGALVWECATGERLGPLATHAAIHRDQVLRALEYVPDPEWRLLASAMLAFDPAARPDAAGARRTLESIARHAAGPSLRDWAQRALTPAREEEWADEVTGTLGALQPEQEEADAERTVTQVGILTDGDPPGEGEEGGAELSLLLDHEPRAGTDAGVLPASVGPSGDAELLPPRLDPAPELSLALDAPSELSVALDPPPELSLALDPELSASLRLDNEPSLSLRLDADLHPAARDPDPEPSLSLRLDSELLAERLDPQDRPTSSPARPAPGPASPEALPLVSPLAPGAPPSIAARAPRVPPPRPDGTRPGAPVITPVLRPPPVLPPPTPPAPPPPIDDEPPPSGLDALPQWAMVIGGAAIGVLGGLGVVAVLLAVLVLRARAG